MSALRLPPAAHFAAHVAARHHPRAARVSPASRVLAIHRTRSWPRPGRWSLTVSPVLPCLVHRADRERLVTRLRAREERRTVRTLERSRVLLERVVQRGTRMDGAHTGAPATTAVAGAARPVPVPRVVPPVPRVLAAVAPRIETAPTTGRDPKPWPKPAPAVGPVPVPPAEVERITDQVLRRIDHRLTAHRERHGWSR